MKSIYLFCHIRKSIEKPKVTKVYPYCFFQEPVFKFKSSAHSELIWVVPALCWWLAVVPGGGPQAGSVYAGSCAPAVALCGACPLNCLRRLK